MSNTIRPYGNGKNIKMHKNVNLSNVKKHQNAQNVKHGKGEKVKNVITICH